MGEGLSTTLRRTRAVLEGWSSSSLDGVDGPLVAAWALVLGIHAAEAEPVFGIARRDDAGTLQLAPVRIALKLDGSAKELIDVASAALRDAPFISVTELKELKGDEVKLETLVVERAQDLEEALAASGATVGMALDGSRLTVRCARAIADTDATERLTANIARALAALKSGEALATIELLSDAERELQVHTWNQTSVDDGRRGTTVPELFAEIAAQTPDAIAVIADDATLTYAELDRRSTALARKLRQLGVGLESCVGICLERSAELVVGLLAISKAGGAYVPLDPTYPRDRLAGMLDDVDAEVVITRRAAREQLPQRPCRWLLLDETTLDGDAAPLASPAIPDSLAYVLFTSGSTGRPKGVEVPHRAIRRLVCRGGFAQLDRHVTVLQTAPVAFDASTFEVWGPLLNGGKLVVHPEAIPTARGLAERIQRTGADTMWLTAGLFNAVVDEEPSTFRGIRRLLIGGEALSLPHVRKALEALPQLELCNGYGPTETTTFATTHHISPSDVAAGSIPIGRPIRDTSLYVVDARGKLAPLGAEGELLIGGDGLARGYRKHPELTAERFVTNPFGHGRVYRTGDRVRQRSDGAIEYLGRRDGQVKIRGFRIELAEIELALAQHPSVRSCRVIARAAAGNKKLVAYVVPTDAGIDARALTASLQARLPEFMVPSSFVWLERLPVTANGKLDVSALPAPDRTRPELDTPYAAPSTPLEVQLCAIWAELLELDRVGALDNFFALGGTSLLAVRTAARLEREAGLRVAVPLIFEHPTAASLAQALGSQQPSIAQRTSRARPREALDDIAIVGMAGRFPGASSVAELWKNLCDGVESIRRFSDSDLDASIPAALRSDPSYVKARGVIDGAELFDAAFFGIQPKDAAILDPQQRVLLEIAWEAMEHAGYVPSRIRGAVGVFAGKYNATYFTQNVAPNPARIEEIGEFQAMVLNERDFVATHLAHRLDLRGPAVTVQSACSTSLVAVAQAVDSLRLGHCDFALAGGASINVPIQSGYLHQAGAMLSPDGRCRPFDADAQGTTFGDGAAMVCLKRLADAKEDGDTIYAVIRGIATNNDGSGKASFTAPSVAGQAAVVSRALELADVDPRSIGYIETHGTATPLGDPIEVEALTRAFREGTSDVGFCGIGSVKSNLGHLVIAAGATGLIKAALALHAEQIPPTLHFRKPNPAIDFAKSPFHVVAALKPWSRGPTPRRAGVSSFGVGGTNAHAILEESPARTSGTSDDRPQLLVLSARSGSSLEAGATRLAAHLQSHPELELADVASTLQLGRKHFPHRLVTLVASRDEAVRVLGSPSTPSILKGHAPARAREVAFLFPGQGSQYAGLARPLYEYDAIAREEIDSSAAELAPVLERDLRELLLAPLGDERADAELRETRLSQPALFVVEHALAGFWLRLGLKPTAMLGHSVGELVCAALSGVMSRRDALRIVALRGALMQNLPRGAMLSVSLGTRDLLPRLPKCVDLAAENSPARCVVAGPDEAIASLEQHLATEQIAARRLSTSHAFHSAMMEPAVSPLREAIRSVELHAPRLPFVSSCTGTWITPEEAQNPDYWARHLRAPVRFSPAVKTLLGATPPVLVECGPRATLSGLARQHQSGLETVASLGDGTADSRPERALLTAVGRLWVAGAELDFSALHAGRRRLRVPLPTYAFDRKRFWISPPAQPEAPLPLPTIETVELAMPNPSPSTNRIASLTQSVKALFEESSGNDIADTDLGATFVELGFDSLFLTQMALALGKRFGTKVSFRDLMENLPSITAVAEHLDRQLPPEKADARPTTLPTARNTVVSPPTITVAATPTQTPAASATVPASVQALVAEQLRLMEKQLALLTGASQAASSTPIERAPLAEVVTPPPAPPSEDTPKGPETYDPKKAFGAIARIHVKKGEELTPRQQARLDAFTRRYNARTAKSKAFTQRHRGHMADPRVVTGFRPRVKELVYPIVVQRSAGSKLWDLDGNSYVDALNGFGCNLFGWQPEFVTRAVIEQLQSGHEIGPQTPLAAECAELVCELTGFDRAAFCNTGSEAVMGCVRIARTVTGRSKIAMFTGSYHGIFDEVIVRGTKKLKSYPAAPGIMANTAENVLVLDYGTPESLEILRQHANELAAVLVEPVQSRRPDFQPREFLHELREITRKSGTVFIFDEVITGFRTSPGGAQEHFGIRADLASYGKVVGGGLPVGIIAGKRELMDALDGGGWQFGDDSVPTVGVTYFAGTFVRHPLALSAVKAVLHHLKAAGPALQKQVTATTQAFAAEMNAHFEKVQAPLHIKHFASLWKTFPTSEQPMGDLLFYMLRDRGVHIYDGFPCFMTTAHDQADVAHLLAAYKESVAEMQESGFFPEPAVRKPDVVDVDTPPVPGARLGRDPQGNAAWFVPSGEPGKYVQLDLTRR
ncbi:MAG: amino acid adenylation domain-containing protein [Deltaproteobacteria bacterium]|nr:amino acid adenylation domain-containing protein [Deltaproteobacteria bacterium]